MLALAFLQFFAQSFLTADRISQNKIPAHPAKQPPSTPASIPLQLKQIQGAVLKLPPNVRHALELDLQVGEFLPLTMDQRGLDVRIEVSFPRKGVILVVDGQNGKNGPELVPILAEQGGRYRIEILGSGAGTYRITSEPKRRATEKDRHRAQAATAYCLGKQLEEKNKLAEAGREYERAARLWRLGGYPLGQADAAYLLGQVRVESNQWEPARESLSEALDLYRRLKSRKLQGFVSMELGYAYAQLGQWKRGAELYEEALSIAQEDGVCDLEINTLKRKVKMELGQGEFGVALADAENQVERARKCGTIDDRVEALNNLGRAHKEMGDPKTAMNFHLQAKALLGKSSDRELWAATLVHLGDSYRDLNQRKTAEVSYLQAIDLWREIGDQGQEAIALNNLGLSYYRMQRLNDARDSLLRSRRLGESLGDQNLNAISALNLGWVLTDLKDFDRAASLYGEALKFSQKEGRRPLESAAYFGLAWMERRRGNLTEAEKYLRQALKILESLRAKADRVRLRQSFFAGKLNFYDLLVDILMEKDQREPGKGFDRAALEASEKARYRTLLDVLEGDVSVPDISTREIQRLLDKDTVLLEYALGETKSFLWVVTSDSLNSYRLPPGDRIRSLARSVNSLMGVTDKEEELDEAVHQATELSRILLGPVAPRLNRKRLLIVAPPELQYVSFHALPIVPMSRKGDLWPTPWLERFEIVVQPSATFLAFLRKSRPGKDPRPESLGLIAAPVFAAGSFPELRFSDAEAAKISRYLKGKVASFLHHEANRELVLNGGLAGFRFLHFSAHGVMSSDSPGDSAIVLSQVNPKGHRINGYLRASEIAKLDLSADLVVLSACSTGLGMEIRGEGLVGLSHAFFTAGASSVVASLWDVDDLGTVELMGDFYQNLFQEKASFSVALRDAQLRMWKQERWNPPYYWGGFVLQGEWR